MNVNISLYRTFCVVARNKSISKAAEELFVSQSAVTQSIKKIESELGEKLFNRQKTGVELTESGKTLFNYLDDNITRIENAEIIFSQYIDLEKGTLRIGGGSTILSSLIVAPLAEFLKKYPKINVSLINGKTTTMVDKLSVGELDIVALYLPFENSNSKVQITNMKKSSYCLYVSKEYYEKNPIKSLKDIKNHNVIIPRIASNKHKIFEFLMKDYDYNKETIYEVSSSAVSNKLVLEGVGIGFSSIDALKEIDSKIKIIKEFDFENETEAIATFKKENMNAVTKEFLKFMKKYYANRIEKEENKL